MIKGTLHIYMIHVVEWFAIATSKLRFWNGKNSDELVPNSSSARCYCKAWTWRNLQEKPYSLASIDNTAIFGKTIHAVCW